MMNACIASAPALASSASVVRVGPNVQVFDNPRPQNEIVAAANPADARNLLIGSNDYRIRGTVWARISSDPAVRPTFIGDYNQIAATSRASYPAWSDFRNGVPGNFNPDAYTTAVFA